MVSESAKAKAEQIKASCVEFAETRLDLPMQTDEELTIFFAPLLKLAQDHGQGPNLTVEMLFDIMSRLPEIESKVDRETLKICIQVDMFKLFSTEQDERQHSLMMKMLVWLDLRKTSIVRMAVATSQLNLLS